MRFCLEEDVIDIRGGGFFCTLFFAKIMIVMMLMVNVVIMMEAKTCSVHREDS